MIRNELTPREHNMYIKKHMNKLTLKEIANEYGVSIERARQIIKLAEMKIDHYKVVIKEEIEKDEHHFEFQAIIYTLLGISNKDYSILKEDQKSTYYEIEEIPKVEEI